MPRQRVGKKPRPKPPLPAAEAGSATEADRAAVDELKRRAETLILSSPEPSAEAIASFADELRGLASESAAAEVVRVIRESWGEEAIPLLENLASGHDRTIELQTVRQLGNLRSEAAVRVLDHVSESAPDKEIRKEAKRSLFKLRSAGLAVETILRRETPAPQPVKRRGLTLWRAFASTYDAVGDRLIVAAVEKPFGGIESATAIVNESKGIAAFAVRDTTRRKWMSEEIEPFERHWKGMILVEIPPDYAKHLLKTAYEKNKASGEEVPRELKRMHPVLMAPERRYERPIVFDDINPVELKWNPQYLEESPSLLDLPEFRLWYLDLHKLAEFAQEIAKVAEGQIALPPWVEKEREADITRRAIEKLFPPEELERYRRQLEETAYILLHTERPRWAKVALAAAIALEGVEIAHLARHPFIATLVRKSMTAAAAVEAEGGDELTAAEGKLVVDPRELARFIDIRSE